jgi:hypothetical protein
MKNSKNWDNKQDWLNKFLDSTGKNTFFPMDALQQQNMQQYYQKTSNTLKELLENTLKECPEDEKFDISHILRFIRRDEAPIINNAIINILIKHKDKLEFKPKEQIGFDIYFLHEIGFLDKLPKELLLGKEGIISCMVKKGVSLRSISTLTKKLDSNDFNSIDLSLISAKLVKIGVDIKNKKSSLISSTIISGILLSVGITLLLTNGPLLLFTAQSAASILLGALPYVLLVIAGDKSSSLMKEARDYNYLVNEQKAGKLILYDRGIRHDTNVGKRFTPTDMHSGVNAKGHRSEQIKPEIKPSK